jgi:hypothetical protein
MLSPGNDVSGVLSPITLNGSPLLGLVGFASVCMIVWLIFWYSHIYRPSIADQMAAPRLPLPASQYDRADLVRPVGRQSILDW